MLSCDKMPVPRGTWSVVTKCQFHVGHGQLWQNACSTWDMVSFWHNACSTWDRSVLRKCLRYNLSAFTVLYILLIPRGTGQFWHNSCSAIVSLVSPGWEHEGWKRPPPGKHPYPPVQWEGGGGVGVLGPPGRFPRPYSGKPKNPPPLPALCLIYFFRHAAALKTKLKNVKKLTLEMSCFKPYLLLVF